MVETETQHGQRKQHLRDECQAEIEYNSWITWWCTMDSGELGMSWCKDKAKGLGRDYWHLFRKASTPYAKGGIQRIKITWKCIIIIIIYVFFFTVYLLILLLYLNKQCSWTKNTKLWNNSLLYFQFFILTSYADVFESFLTFVSRSTSIQVLLQTIHFPTFFVLIQTLWQVSYKTEIICQHMASEVMQN